MLAALLTAILTVITYLLFINGYHSEAILPGVIAVVSFLTPGFFGFFRS